jgi:hypothetical protein
MKTKEKNDIIFQLNVQNLKRNDFNYIRALRMIT